MKDDQARASIRRIDKDYNSVFRRLERLEMDRSLDRNRISDMDRMVCSDNYLLQLVVADQKKLLHPTWGRLVPIETELC